MSTKQKIASLWTVPLNIANNIYLFLFIYFCGGGGKFLNFFGNYIWINVLNDIFEIPNGM